MRTSKPRKAAAKTDVRGYPRPQLVREQWINLNGTWDFAIDADATITSPKQVKWDRRIVVPFAPETSSSGIQDTSLFKACWYRRTFTAPEVPNDQRLILHFGAVDYCARVWI